MNSLPRELVSSVSAGHQKIPALPTPFSHSTWCKDRGVVNKNPDKNLGTTFKRCIARHLLQEWAKPFLNLSSIWQTELEQHFPT